MASIFDSIRTVYTDSFSIIKLGAFSYVLNLLYKLMQPTAAFNIINFFAILVMIYVCIGFSSIIIGNRINQRLETLPTFNPLYFFTVSTKAFIIAIPFMVITFFVVSFIVGLFNFEGLPQLIAIWMVRFFVFCCFITSIINFSENNSVKDGLNITKIFSGVADVLVYTVVCTILLAIYISLLGGPTLYLIYTFFKIGPIFEFVSMFIITYSLAIYSDYWGQLHFEMQSKDSYY